MPPVVEVSTIVKVPVGCDGVQLSHVFICLKLEFPDFVVVVAHGKIAARDKATEAAQAAFDFVAVATFFQEFDINLVRLNRYAMPPAVIGITKCQPAPAGKPACATAPVSAAY